MNESPAPSSRGLGRRFDSIDDKEIARASPRIGGKLDASAEVMIVASPAPAYGVR